MEQQNLNTRIIRLPEVMQKTGLGRSSIYKMMGEGKFPKSIQLGARAIGWSENTIDMWIKLRISSSKNNSGA